MIGMKEPFFNPEPARSFSEREVTAYHFVQNPDMSVVTSPEEYHFEFNMIYNMTESVSFGNTNMVGNRKKFHSGASLTSY